LCPSETESASPRKRARDDEAAFHELVDRYANEMFRLAVSLVGNAADAEDVVQETFTGAFQAMPDFEGRSSVRTWLSRILVKQAAKWRRRRNVRRTVVLDATAPGPSPEQGLRIDVLGTLETLSPEHREVIALREFQGMSYEEIAEVLGVPRGTVESRLFRARQELRGRLKAYLP
jgi:RNA polymerase sigma-70 factor (ECF subfamily)